MRIDAHVHIFPPAPARQRGELLRDLTYRTLYGHPKARAADADALVASMDASGIAISVAANIGWATMDLCRETNDYIMESARRHAGRLVPFCSVNPLAGDAAVRELERCVALGARGIGELHPDSQGYDLGDRTVMAPLVETAQRHGMVILTHASEPVGHVYPGKGQVTPQVLYRFVSNFPEARIIAAHWGGGLPFYALMPEVAQALANVAFDTAASPFLYDARVFETVARLVGAEKLLFGSDFPLMKQGRPLKQLLDSSLKEDEKALMLGDNAARLLGLSAPC